MLYEQYIKVITDTEKIERVSKMDMYYEKMQLRYHTPAEAQAIWKKAEKKNAESMAKKNVISERINRQNNKIYRIDRKTHIGDKEKVENMMNRAGAGFSALEPT